MSLNASNRGDYVDSALFLSPPGNWGGVVGAMKPGAHLLLFSSVKSHHVETIAAEDNGLEIRDTISYVFHDSENGKSNVAMKLVAVARKPLEGTVAENILRYGTGGLNIDGCRILTKGKETLSRNNNSRKNSIFNEGDWGTGTFGSGDSAGGRWPANLLHCGSPVVKEMFPNCKPSPSPSKPIVRGKRTALVYGKQVNAEGTMWYGYGDGGSASRFFYSAPCLNNLCSYLIRLVTPLEGTVLTDCNVSNLPCHYRYLNNYEN